MAITPLLNLYDAQGGVEGAGRALCAEIADRLRYGALDKEGLELVVSMFERVAAGEDANVVLLVTRTHRPKKSGRDLWIWQRVCELLEEKMRPSDAYRVVASELETYGEPVEAKTVKNIFLRYQAGERWLNTEYGEPIDAKAVKKSFLRYWDDAKPRGE
ncbi:MAG: hypothetical protein KUL77_07815 [Thermomonas sp.]|nr:hypothetical protein [Thermomonas sp.]